MRHFLVSLTLLACSATLAAQPAPPSARRLEELRAQASGQGRLAASTPLTVNVASREEVRQFYLAVYHASEDIPMGWTGSYTAGGWGDTSSAFKDSVLLRINFFRALVGVPATVTFNPTYSAKAQQAALMMSANSWDNGIDPHHPPSTWQFFTEEGFSAANNSNLTQGLAGPDAITGYLADGGDNNRLVGHRRWLLYPQTREMGTGDVPGKTGTFQPANATWVIDGNFDSARPATRTTYVPYPPAGYVPYQLVWPRWSFSYPGADFANATVVMTRNNQPVAVAIESRTTDAGEPTIVWAYNGADADAASEHPKPGSDTTYGVAVNNVRINGASQNFNYNVVVFDPALPGNDTVSVSLSGATTVPIGVANNYTVTKPSFTVSFDWRALLLSSFAKTYGAESGLDSIVPAISASYNLVQSSIVGSGGAAYRLTHPALTDPSFFDQSFTLPETFVVTNANAVIAYLSRLGVAAQSQVARVQVSVDDGRSWADVFTQSGTNDNGENNFVRRTVSLSSYVGRAVRVRFNYTYTPGSAAFVDTDNGVGWYVDNITLTNVQAASTSSPTSVAGASFTYTAQDAGTIGLQARAVLLDAFPLEWGSVLQVTANNAPGFTTQPASQSLSVGSTLTLTVASTAGTLRWQVNGADITGATNATLNVADLQPANAGLYTAIATSSGGTTSSKAAIVGLTSSAKVIGSGSEISPNVPHPNGNVFDQVLLTGTAETITADVAFNQVTRTSYIDLDNDIVQVEFSGPGALTLVLDSPTGPAVPVNYNQPSVTYMKGHAGIVITGATEQTNVSVFTVGRATAFDPTGAYNILQVPSATNVPANNGSSLFAGHTNTVYDGMADIAFIAISSSNGKFGGIRTSNTSYSASKGLTGIYAPGIAFQGPVFVGDIAASASAKPVFVIGSSADTRVTGGSLAQPNGQPVEVAGLTQLKFTAGGDSHGHTLSAKANQAVLEQDGTNVTSQIVVNP